MSKFVISKRITQDDERHRLRVWVSETTNNIPGQLFVYQAVPKVPLDDRPDGVFVHIASYADTLMFPIDEPDTESPFYRLYYIDLIFDSLVVLNEKWDLMRLMLNQTIEDIVRINNLPPVEVEEVNA
ncbi:MAG: hypothetical protein ACXABY_37260 [Candidatus Thorarchaeota archaeon]|jgi:hypothetical protein